MTYWEPYLYAAISLPFVLSIGGAIAAVIYHKQKEKPR